MDASGLEGTQIGKYVGMEDKRGTDGDGYIHVSTYVLRQVNRLRER